MIVLDTHVLVWWVSGAGRLSPRARRELRSAVPRAPALASAISVLEIATAVRRGRLSLGVPVGQWFADLGALPELRLQPVTADIAALAGSFDEHAPGDPADRLIAATAISLGAKLITADSRLRAMPRLQSAW